MLGVRTEREVDEKLAGLDATALAGDIKCRLIAAGAVATARVFEKYAAAVFIAVTAGSASPQSGAVSGFTSWARLLPHRSHPVSVVGG